MSDSDREPPQKPPAEGPAAESPAAESPATEAGQPRAAAPEAPKPPDEGATPVAASDTPAASGLQESADAAADDEAARNAAVEAAAKAKAAVEARAAAEAAKPPWERDAVSPEWEPPGDDPLAAAVGERFGEAIVSAQSYAGDLTFEVATASIAEVARALKDDHGYTYMVDLCGADYPDREPRFDIVYQLHNFADNRRIRLRVKTDEATPVPTVSGVWRVANWCEREAYDMYGVRFADHPDMTRILLWEGFNGHPLRKDFPVEGLDTGAAIYPEYYEPSAGPVAGTGTGWKPPAPPEDEPTDGAGEGEAG